MDTSLDGVKVCYFGHYNPDYSRNRIMQKALRRVGAEITEVNCYRVAQGINRYRHLLRRALEHEFDLMIVGFAGATDMPLAKLLCSLKKVPLILDALVSSYDAVVCNRAIVSPRSLRAWKLYYTDSIASRLANVVLLESNARIQYFVETFGVSPEKFRRIWIGADGEIMYPRAEVAQSSEFTIFFYGSFVPLQGIEYIIEAAKILETRAEPVRFTIVGSGLTYSRIRETAERLGVRTVLFLGRVPYENLPILMSQSHICLGIFGTPPTTQRVVPNKVFDALAVRRAVITADTPAIGEAGLVHGEHLWLCAAGSGEALADAIVTLKHNADLREFIAGNGYRHFCGHFSIDAIAEELVPVVQEVLSCGRKQG